MRSANFEGILGFSFVSIILPNLLGNACLLARVQKVMVCDSWLVDFDPFFSCFVFQGSLLCDGSVSDDNRLVEFTSQIFLIFLIFVTFDKKSTHHRDFLHYS